MVALDTSASMTTSVGISSGCGFGNTRSAHGRCAVRNTIQAYAGTVNFGLSSYAILQSSCGASCFTNCDYFCYQAEIDTTGNCLGCGPRGGNATTRAGARILVPVQQDNFWSLPPAPSNASTLLGWVDNDCSASTELWAIGASPINGVLRDLRRYFASSWTAPDFSVTHPTPLNVNDRACRSVNVILIIDGDENCDTQVDAVNAATDLYLNPVVVGGKSFPIRTHVINFAGASQANADQIAAAGGTGFAYFVLNETQLTQALANIVQGSLVGESCDNLDNDCNGCTDEGFPHYANIGQTCCAWSTAPQRSACLNNYRGSITQASPQGNRDLLPCTSAAQQTQPANWLCYEPGDRCDGLDNTGQGGIDEGARTCGSPPHCPATEVCNGQDDDCDGLVDESGVCPGGCVVRPEVCNGCDDDCDGMVDDGIAAIPCGFGLPANCQGLLACKPPVPVSPGGCAVGRGYEPCSSSPQPEICDGIDNDCNGAADDAMACPCAQRGELCNGVDDDCDGAVDEGLSPPPASQVCGVSPSATVPECTTKLEVRCEGGSWECAFLPGVCSGPGGCGGTPEICDLLDNNCNGQLNENVAAYGIPCTSDDGLPAPGHGRCRTQGFRVCSGPAATVCSASPAPCAALTGGCTESCDGIDNDCDGLSDEPFSNKGTVAAHFVRPAVTRIGASLWIDSYEASRADATGVVPGHGNGYACKTVVGGDPVCGDASIPVAPPGATLDRTVACSAGSKMPWYLVAPAEAEQVCKARGGRLCTTGELQSACAATASCTWGYNPRGAACTTPFTGSKYCNLAPSHDSDSTAAGDQDDPLATGSPALLECWADWSGLQGNSSATDKVFDITGNLREITRQAASDYRLMGGAFDSGVDAGSACAVTTFQTGSTFQSSATGFRCCYTSDPGQ
jgi:hypothetical protein